MFLMLYSPPDTGLLLVLMQPSGDGYFRLCSSKSSFCGTDCVTLKNKYFEVMKRLCRFKILQTEAMKQFYLLSTCCNERKYGLHSEQSLWKGAESGRPVSVDYTPFYRQHLCGGHSVHKNIVGHNNTCGTVSSLLFFPMKITAAQRLHFQHLMWTEVMSSRRLY